MDIMNCSQSLSFIVFLLHARSLSSHGLTSVSLQEAVLVCFKVFYSCAAFIWQQGDCLCSVLFCHLSVMQELEGSIFPLGNVIGQSSSWK